MTPCDKLLISAEKLTQGRLICHMKPKTEKSGKSETKKTDMLRNIGNSQGSPQSTS